MGEPMMNEQNEPATVSFKRFALSRLSDLAFSLAGMAGSVAVAALRDELKKAEAGVMLGVRDEHWEMLRAVTAKPNLGPGGALDPYYAPVILPNMLPHMRAICEASDTAPPGS